MTDDEGLQQVQIRTKLKGSQRAVMALDPQPGQVRRGLHPQRLQGRR